MTVFASQGLDRRQFRIRIEKRSHIIQVREGAGRVLDVFVHQLGTSSDFFVKDSAWNQIIFVRLVTNKGKFS